MYIQDTFIYRLFLHCAWALSFFCGTALLVEFFIPGSVAVYIDPLPFTIIAIVGLCLDAVIRVSAKRRIIPIVLTSLLISLFCFLYFFTGGGVRNFVAGALVASTVLFCGWVLGR